MTRTERIPSFSKAAAAGLILVLGACSSDNTGTVIPFDPDPQTGDSIPALGPAVYNGADFEIVPIMEGLRHPWGLAFLPDGRLLVTEREGRLRLIQAGQLSEPLQGVPEVRAVGQGGLLDVALHPDFENNRWVYLSYATWTEGGNGTTEVARGRLDGDALVGTEVIFTAQVHEMEMDAHFGSRLVFDREGYLYVSVGDRRSPFRAQSTENHHGTLVRLADDGSIPESNPFVGDAEVLPSIFAYGIRNPQGLTVHPETGDVLWSEHGPLGGDEINIAHPGANYGWPAITHGLNYDGTPVSDKTEAPGMEQPLIHWEPSIAPSGLAIYSGQAFPQWRGDAFTGGLAARTLVRVEMEGLEATGWEPVMADGWGLRVRDVRDGPDGFLYILTDESEGGVYRLQPRSD